MYKLGIDVGGTNTDAVLIDENRKVIADIKYPTSGDVYDGILGAVRTVLEVSGIDRREIRQAMLGTTQCTNAIVERKHLAPIGILRIGAPATTGIRPMVDWAEDIQKIAAGSVIVGGGFEYDGKELAPFDREAAASFFREMKNKGVNSILFYDLLPIYIEEGYEYVETNVELETNTKVQSQWIYFERRQHKRRRCFKKELK